MDQIGLHRSGKIRMLASSAAQRSPLLPEVPTFAEAGLKGVEGTSWFAVYAPAKTPEATVRQVNAAINKALASPELRERFGKLGLEPTGGGNEARHRALGTGGQGVGLQGAIERIRGRRSAARFGSAAVDFLGPFGGWWG